VLTDVDVQALQAIVGEDYVSKRQADLEAHSVDESWIEPHLPDLVIWPASTEEIAAILRYANSRSLSIVPWSGGSSLEGNPIPIYGGIVLAMNRLDKVLEIIEEDLQVVVQPGVVYDALNAQLGRHGMFFPPAPGSADVATIGGMVANNSSGMRAIKYGVTRDYVLKLRIVLPDGEVISVGSNATKSSSGYDLTGLFVGSEGTLGVVTEVTLRVMGLPEKVAAVVAVFDELDDATNTVYEVIRYGLTPSAIELLDSATVHVTNQQQGLALRETPTLFVEFHGNEADVAEQIDALRGICQDNNCSETQIATTTESREKLWTARREAHDSIKFSNPGYAMISGDVCVPMSKFGEMVAFVRALSERAGVAIYAFGHAGDGNLHTEAVARKDVPDEFARGLQATDELIAHALELGGTATGEHGVGLGKRQFMQREHGASLKVMQAIKNVIDPKGIMNPGKIFPVN
jgi:D-lactate dehydrogenase (cytochrome)